MRKKCVEDSAEIPGMTRKFIGSRKATPAVLGFIAATRAR